MTDLNKVADDISSTAKILNENYDKLKEIFKDDIPCEIDLLIDFNIAHLYAIADMISD